PHIANRRQIHLLTAINPISYKGLTFKFVRLFYWTRFSGKTATAWPCDSDTVLATTCQTRFFVVAGYPAAVPTKLEIGIDLRQRRADTDSNGTWPRVIFANRSAY